MEGFLYSIHIIEKFRIFKALGLLYVYFFPKDLIQKGNTYIWYNFLLNEHAITKKILMASNLATRVKVCS